MREEDAKNEGWCSEMERHCDGSNCDLWKKVVVLKEDFVPESKGICSGDFLE